MKDKQEQDYTLILLGENPETGTKIYQRIKINK